MLIFNQLYCFIFFKKNPRCFSQIRRPEVRHLLRREQEEAERGPGPSGRPGEAKNKNEFKYSWVFTLLRIGEYELCFFLRFIAHHLPWRALHRRGPGSKVYTRISFRFFFTGINCASIPIFFFSGAACGTQSPTSRKGDSQWSSPRTGQNHVLSPALLCEMMTFFAKKTRSVFRGFMCRLLV